MSVGWLLLVVTACAPPAPTSSPVLGAPGNGGNFDDHLDTATGDEEICDGLDNDDDGKVDEGWDADGDGQADCMEKECPALDLGKGGSVDVIAACLGGDVRVPVADPWNVDVKWTFGPSADGFTQAAGTPVVGELNDDNRDGQIDDADVPDIVLGMIDGLNAVLVAIDGETGVEEWSAGGLDYATGSAIADVDADGFPDVISTRHDGHVTAFEGDGRPKWTSADEISETSGSLLSVADLEGDGSVEVIAYDTVLNGKDGSTLFTMDTDHALYVMAAVGDVDLDGDQEIAFSGKLYDSDGTLLWDIGNGPGDAMWPIMVQADDDPTAEIVNVSGTFSLLNDDGLLINRVDSGSSYPSPHCAGDLTGDGISEIAGFEGDALVARSLDGTVLWTVPTVAADGYPACSAFDMDGVGGLEILTSGPDRFAVYDGATGVREVSRALASSGLGSEYPTVVDLDHDGHAEILVVRSDDSGDSPALWVFEHHGGGWPAAGSGWNIHDFAMTNIEADGTVPASPSPYWTANGGYRARVPADAPATPDLSATITDVCIADCDYGPVEVAVQVQNNGGADAAAGSTLTLYALDGGEPVEVASATLGVVPAGHSMDGVQFELTADDIGSQGWRVVLDTSGVVDECDETNNVAEWLDSVCL